MFIDYIYNGEKLTDVAYNGKDLISLSSSKVFTNNVTVTVPSLEMEELDLREITFDLHLKDGRMISDSFISFKEGELVAFDKDLKPIDNIDALYVTVVEKEIEYCMDCHGATIKGNEPCLTCGGDGSLW